MLRGRNMHTISLLQLPLLSIGSTAADYWTLNFTAKFEALYIEK